MNLIGAVILAAGGSVRMGEPKQILQFQGKSLIRRITETALTVIPQPVVVVLGAYANKVGSELAGLSVHPVINTGWATGIASSIRMGLLNVLEISPNLESVLLMVCDQPHIQSNLLTNMIQLRSQNHHPIVACAYDNTIGTPAIFSKTCFPELMKLKEHEGARKLIQEHPAWIGSLPFPEGGIDIDTLQDYSNLLHKR
jgi:molybdenum cofactor cytidylyltransferase